MPFKSRKERIKEAKRKNMEKHPALVVSREVEKIYVDPKVTQKDYDEAVRSGVS